MSGIISEHLGRQGLHTKSELHIARKLWHVTAGGLMAASYFQFEGLGQTHWAFIAAVIGVLSWLMDFVRLRVPKLNHLFLKSFKLVARKSEATGYSGVPFFAFGCAFSLYLFEEKVAILSILFLIIADPLASLVGIVYGRDKIFPGKSIQGSMTCLVTCYLITLIFCLQYTPGNLEVLMFSLLCGLMGALSELCSHWVDDNFTIPVVSGCGITFMNAFLHIL